MLSFLQQHVKIVSKTRVILTELTCFQSLFLLANAGCLFLELRIALEKYRRQFNPLTLVIEFWFLLFQVTVQELENPKTQKVLDHMQHISCLTVYFYVSSLIYDCFLGSGAGAAAQNGYGAKSKGKFFFFFLFFAHTL